MKNYLEMCQFVLDEGSRREDRTGTGTTGVFGYQMRFDLSKVFPCLQLKKFIFHRLRKNFYGL